MKDRIERFVVLPFSLGCSSRSSVTVVGLSEPKKAKRKDPNGKEGEEKGFGGDKSEESSSFTISNGIQKLMGSLRSLSQSFVYKEETEEMEMEIGLPTDVTHVTHIGLDGPMTTAGAFDGFDPLQAPEITCPPSISLRHFELAIAGQANQPYALDPSKLS